MGRTSRRRKSRKKTSIICNEDDQIKFWSLYKEMIKLGWSNCTHLKVQDFKGTGRGLYSKKLQFDSEDVLIRLPLEVMITINTLEDDSEFKDLFSIEKDDCKIELPFMALLASYLLYAKHKNSSSFLKSYLEMLPNYFTTPLFCNLNELRYVPEDLLREIVAINRNIKHYHNQIHLLMKEQLCPCCGASFEQNIFTLNSFKWAYYVVNTRSVHVQSRLFKKPKSFFEKIINGSTNIALAPFFDLFNHSDEVRTRAELLSDHEKSKWEFLVKLEKCSKPIPPYSQVFINYGLHNNRKLLVEYGFFLPYNKNDFFEFSLEDIERLLKEDKTFSGLSVHRAVFKFIREHNLQDAMFASVTDGPSHNLMVVLNLIFKQESYFPNVLNRIAFGDENLLEDITAEFESLLNFKIIEYTNSYEAFQKLNDISPSAGVCRDFFKETLNLLDKIKFNLDITQSE